MLRCPAVANAERSETRALTALYIPRGYISTQQAVSELVEARHPDLASTAQAREEEERGLLFRKSMSLPPPITALGVHRPRASGRAHSKFNPADRQRLEELLAIKSKVQSLSAATAMELRAALAEGDLSSILLLDSGDEKPMDRSRWRAIDGFDIVCTARLPIQVGFRMGPTEGTVLIKEADFIAWMVSVDARKPPSMHEGSAETLPLWFTPMEAVAWIVARHARIVAYASPIRNAMRSFIIDHVLPNGKRISGEFEPPAGMSLLWLDLLASYDAIESVPTDQALAELLAALQLGRVTARAIWVASGDRRDMGADEWHGLVLDTPPRNERVLLPYRTDAASLAKQPETRWKDVLLPRNALLASWPAAPPVHPTQTSESAAAGWPASETAAVPDSLSSPAKVASDTSFSVSPKSASAESRSTIAEGTQQLERAGSEQATAPVSDRTGAQGRPTSRHIVMQEFQRRIENKAVLDALGEEAQALSDWLAAEHPGFPPMTRKTVENSIRDAHRNWKTSK